ncbi:MAG: hypothetical protein AAB670_00570 [Patescibacteria group bacterium]
MSRIYLQTDHREKVRGMGKEELISKVQYFTRRNLGLAMTKRFLRRFGAVRLYSALQAAQHHNENSDIFKIWKEQKKVVQEKLPF